MSDTTLFLVQANYSQCAAVLMQLQKIHSPQDMIVLLGESVLALAQFSVLGQVKILQNELDLLPAAQVNDEMLLSYAQFADLVCQFTRCVTLK